MRTNFCFPSEEEAGRVFGFPLGPCAVAHLKGKPTRRVEHFYKGQDHATHILSVWRFSLDHTVHIVFGLILIGVGIAGGAFLTLRRTGARSLPNA